MPTFLGLKQNSPAAIISTKNYRTAMISNWQQHNNKVKTPMHDQGHYCLQKVKLRQDKNSYVKLKIDKKFTEK